MSNIFNPDFQNLIKALNNNDVDYILLGGYAVIEFLKEKPILKHKKCQ